jgi:hypothetical protein
MDISSLCRYCQRIFGEDLEYAPQDIYSAYIPHHPNIYSLFEAVNRGCHLCFLICATDSTEWSLEMNMSLDCRVVLREDRSKVEEIMFGEHVGTTYDIHAIIGLQYLEGRSFQSLLAYSGI